MVKSKKKTLADQPVNYYEYTEEADIHNPNYAIHMLTIPFYAAIVSKSGGGKTQLLMDLIMDRFNNTFVEIIICVKSKHEPLYKLLEEKGGPNVKIYENKVPDIEDFKDKAQRLIAFDDLVLSKELNKNICEYYMKARKYSMSCVYLSQSYYAIPIFIRKQLDYLFMKKIGNEKEFGMIIREMSLGIDKLELIHLYREITKDKRNFLLIDLNPSEEKYMFRFNYLPLEINTTIV